MKNITTPALETVKNVAAVAPKLGVALDLASYSSYVPAFWPGQKISGRLRIEAHAPIDVINFRVVLYGSAKVHGDGPDRPFSNGVFTYHKNTQLISSGIRVVPRGMAIPSTPTTPTSPTTSIYNGEQKTQRAKSSASNYEKDMATPTMCEQIQNKSNLDKEIESMIRKIASEFGQDDRDWPTMQPQVDIAEESDQQQRLKLLLEQEDNPPRSFYLPPKEHQVRFAIRIPTTRQLPGSYDHPHFPIEYNIVAVLLLTDLETGAILTTHAMAPLRIESQVNVLNEVYASTLRSSARLWTSSQSFWTRLCQGNRRRAVYEDDGNGAVGGDMNTATSNSNAKHSRMNQDSIFGDGNASNISNTIKVSERQKGDGSWAGRMLPSGFSSILPHGGGNYAKALDCTVELPRKAIQRSEPIPLLVHLVNGSNISIAYVVIKLELVRRILMTFNVGEVADTELVYEGQATFCGDEHSPEKSLANISTYNNSQANVVSQFTAQSAPTEAPSAFCAREIFFDLSALPSIPGDFPCTVTADATRNTFEIVYDLAVTCKVFESKSKRPNQPHDLSNPNRVSSMLYAKHKSPSPEVKLPEGCNIHVLSPSPIPLVLGSISNDETETQNPANAML